jgi:uncharacterized protein VirK/YbjX
MPLVTIKPVMGLLQTRVAALGGLALARNSATRGVRKAFVTGAKGSWLLIQPQTLLRTAWVFRLPAIRCFFRAEPRLLYKYLSPYVAANLSRGARASILIDHYTFLGQRLCGRALRSIVHSRHELWSRQTDGHTYRIVLTFPRATHDEGDLALLFEADGIDIYTLSFALGPGSISGAVDGRALYIARVQGRARGLPAITHATKDCLDVSPAWSLLAAAEGVASALDIHHMLGVSARNQITADREFPHLDLEKAYDDLWQAAGGRLLDRGFYHLAVPAEPKPLQFIQRSHRRRAKRKREFRNQVADQVSLGMRKLILAR